MLAFACVVAVHTVWWVLPIPNTTPEVTEAHMTPLNPCGWTYWVWIPIYALQGFGVVFQALGRGYCTNRWKWRAVTSIGVYWQLGWLAHIAWVILFVRDGRFWMAGALLARLLGLIFFMIAYIRLHRSFSQKRVALPMLTRTYLYLILPTVMTLALLSFLTANGVLIVMHSFGIGFHSLAAKIVTAALLIVLTVLGVALEYWYREVFFCLIITWCFVGVFVRTHSTKLVYIVCLTVVGSMTIVSILRKVYGLEKVQEGGRLTVAERLLARIFVFTKKLKRCITPKPTWEEETIRSPLKASIV